MTDLRAGNSRPFCILILLEARADVLAEFDFAERPRRLHVVDVLEKGLIVLFHDWTNVCTCIDK